MVNNFNKYFASIGPDFARKISVPQIFEKRYNNLIERNTISMFLKAVELFCLSFFLYVPNKKIDQISDIKQCCRFLTDGLGVILCPNLAFLPKILSEFHLTQPVELRSLFSPVEGQVAEPTQSTLCPLAGYIRCTIRKTDQLFICFESNHLGRPLSKSRLSHWVVDVIEQAYLFSGVPVRPGYGHTQPIALLRI